MDQSASNLNFRHILTFWLPLELTWLMMSLEGTVANAIIARLPEPKFNLAAYGVAHVMVLVIEAPILMIMSAANALIKDRDSYLKMRRFTFALIGITTVVLLLGLTPPVFDFLMGRLVGLPENVSRLTYLAAWIMAVTPAAIGYRRFYQGILIHHNRTRFVAYGTVLRLLFLCLAGLPLFFWSGFAGAAVGSAALASGITVEALVSRFMARRVVAMIMNPPVPFQATEESLTYSGISSFYLPLALTSLLGLGIHPLITFFVGQSRLAIESLAVLPVINALVWMFMSFGFSFQETTIALMGQDFANFRPLRNAAAAFALLPLAGLAVFSFTPASALWFEHVSGLSPELTAFAILPAQIMTLMPGLWGLNSFQRSVLVVARRTRFITWATGLEVILVSLTLFIGVKILDLVGAVAAASALVTGRAASCLYLVHPFLKARSQRRP